VVVIVCWFLLVCLLLFCFVFVFLVCLCCVWVLLDLDVFVFVCGGCGPWLPIGKGRVFVVAGVCGVF